jgi:hypothetical protein
VAVAFFAVASLLLVRWVARGSSEQPQAREGHAVVPMPITSASGRATSAGVDLAAQATGLPAAPGAPGAPGSGTAGLASAGAAGPGAVPAAPDAARPSPGSGPALRLSKSAVDLGEAASSGAVQVISEGSEPVRFAVGPTPSWLDVSPDGARLDVGETASLVVKLDRRAAPAGVLGVDVGVSAVNGTGGGTIRVTASVSGPPKIVSVVAEPNVVYSGGCAPSAGPDRPKRPTRSTVRVTTEDTTGVFSVAVVARLPDGRTTTTPLDLKDGRGTQNVWSGPVGPSASAGTLTFTVTATDFDRLRTEQTGSIKVERCAV